jgi:hypothetical protein
VIDILVTGAAKRLTLEDRNIEAVLIIGKDWKFKE